MLKDTNTYTEIKKDPTRKMINNLRILLTRWKNSDYIFSAKSYKSLYCSDGILPRAYGLPKIHKLDNSLDLLFLPLTVLFILYLSFLCFIYLSLQKILIERVLNTFSYIHNSFYLTEKFKKKLH